MKMKKGPHKIDFPTNLGTFTVSYRAKLPINPDTGNILLPGAFIEKVNKEILSRLAGKEGLFTPKELVFIFSVLPYTQSEIAFATGKSKSTLSHYKSGENPPDLLFCHTIKEIISDFCNGREKTLNHLRKMAEAAENLEEADDEIWGTKNIQIA